MKKILFLISVILFLIPINAHSLTTQNLSLKAVKCNPEDYTNVEGIDQYYACIDDYLAGSLDTYIVSNNGNIEPGDVLLIIVDYTPGSTLLTTGINATIKYEPEVISILNNPDENVMFYDYDASQFPKSGRNTNWITEMNNDTTTSNIKLIASDLTSFKPLVAQTELGYFFAEVNENATIGSNINLDYSAKAGDVIFADADGVKLDFTTTNFILNVYGEQSTDATLKTLSITNSTNTYTLSPSFIPGSNQVLTYSTVVPNDIASVNINATSNNEYATILSSNLGDKNLSVGNNSFQIVVTSQYGNIETYTINVYRLSSDASLKSLSLSSGAFNEPFSNTTYSYTKTVPYSTISDTIVGEVNHSNATISGTGTFPLQNYGDTPNTRTVAVSAENCKSIYLSVPGNSCTYKNYTISITRENPSTNNYLKNIIINDISLEDFDKETQSYTLDDVNNNISSIKIEASLEDDKATIVSGIGNINLNVGNNEIIISVKSESQEQRDYKINVRRKNNLTALKSLNITSTPNGTLSPSFLSSFNGEYTYTYPETVTSINVNAEVEDTNNAYISLINSTDPNNLISGTLTLTSVSESFTVPITKKIIVSVTSEDGTVGNYVVNLTRQESTDANLKSLILSEGTLSPVFSSNTVLYTVSVSPDIENVEIIATPNSTYATIDSIVGNENLKFGSNTITITVKAEDNSTKSYIVNLIREKYTDAALSDIKINNVSINNFNAINHEYNIDVPYNTASVNVTAINRSQYGTVNGVGEESLTTGNNTIVLTSYAHDTSVTEIYTIYINRQKNSDTGIKSIKVAGNTAVWNEVSQKYEVTVPNDISTVNSDNVVVEVNNPLVETDKKATVSMKSTNLSTLTKSEHKLTVTAEDGTEKDYIIEITRTKSNIAFLSGITVSNGSFSPSFKSDVYTYKVLVPKTTTSFVVSATKTDSNSLLTGVGEYTLDSGTKTIELIVISEDESTTKKYTLNIEKIKSSDNTLSSLSITSGDESYDLNPIFNAETTSYSVNVPGEINEVTVNASLNDTNAIIESGTGKRVLEFGINTVTLRVRSESGAILDYTIAINRLSKTNSYLSDIKINNVSIEDFDKRVNEYTLDSVEYSVDSIQISAEVEDDNATIISGTGTKTLSTGENQFDIVVEAQDGSRSTYKLIISRAKNNDATLKVLSINGVLLNPNFSSNVENYNITVSNDKTSIDPADVTALATDNNAQVAKKAKTILSTTNTSVYEVLVTAEDGVTTKKYSITVTREKSSDNTLNDIILTGATLSPLFSADILSYTITVPYAATTFAIEGVKNNSAAVVQGNGIYNANTVSLNINVTSETGEVKTYTFDVINALSNDASLNSLSIDGYNLNTTFVGTTTVYNIGSVPYTTENLKINAVARNANAQIEYYVNSELQENNIVTIPTVLGSNNIMIKVTAADGITTKTYDIGYSKSYSNNAYLSSIVPSEGSISFNRTSTLYTLNVSESVESVSFELSTEDINASINANGISDFQNLTVTVDDLKSGANQLEILVTAQDGVTKKTYTISIVKASPAPSNNALLSSLSVLGYSLNETFSSDKLEYTIGDIPYSTSSLTINAVTNNASSQVKYYVNNNVQESNIVATPLVNGTGTISIEVTAEDGTTIKTYEITYTKAASSNAYLKRISVSEGSINFNKNTFGYQVSIGSDINTIDITVQLEDETAQMSVNKVIHPSPYTLSISTLSSSQTISIVNTAEDGTILTYTVIIKKQSNVEEITSIEYGHEISDDMIKTAEVNKTVLDMKNQLDNDNSKLEIWNAENTQKLSDTFKLSTGQIVKLIVENEEIDRKIIVVKGDADGSGIIDLFDAVKVLNHYLDKVVLIGPYLQAADTNKDEIIDLFDAVLILNHFLERTLLF